MEYLLSPDDGLRHRTPEPEYFAADGLRARGNGVWAKDKLSFLDDYGPVALQATRGMRDRWYIDLFAGPGINVDKHNVRDEWPGSALRAVRMHGTVDVTRGFEHAVLVNRDRRDHAALVARMDRLAGLGQLVTPRSGIDVVQGDSNTLVASIMRRIHPRAYAFVMADIEAPSQLPWSTVEALRAHGHRSVDLYVLFPLDMGLNRMLSHNVDSLEQCAPTLNAFFGCEDWRPIWERRQRREIRGSVMRTELMKLYIRRLKAVPWRHAGVARYVKRKGRAGLYHMLYATDHDVGGKLARWAAERPIREIGQAELF